MFYTLIKKDLAEHGSAMLLFTAGLGLSVYLALLQNQAAIAGVSGLQIVRIALISLIPLISFIMGQRLIVAEYLGKTQLFVESLPIRAITLVSAKFVFGLLFTLTLAGFVLAFTGYAARVVDSIDTRYAAFLTIKTMSIAALIWSIVFCFSFCGFIRIALYLCVIVLILLLVNSPAFDATGFGPFELMDSQLFVFERERLPVRALVETAGMTLLFVATGFALPLLNEGAIAEQLAKPMSRRDVVVTGLILVGGLILLSKLTDSPQPARETVASSQVLRSTDPRVSVAYRQTDYVNQGRQVMTVILSSLNSLQETLGIVELAPVRIVQDNNLVHGELRLDSSDEVAIRVDLRPYDSYAANTLAAVVLHEQLQYLSNRRLSFEPYHWMLDGVARWWVEARSGIPTEAHHHELLALAAYALEQFDRGWSLSTDWQLITDRVGYPAAEALAYTAIYYLAEKRNPAVVEQLATAVLLPPRSGSSWTTAKTWLRSVDEEFSSSTDLDLAVFLAAWREWLATESASGDTAWRLSQLSSVSGSVTLSAIKESTLLLNLNSQSTSRNTDNQESVSCRLQYQLITPFDHEMEAMLEEREALACDLSDYEVSGVFGSGDRIYVVLESISTLFDAPLRIWQGRLNLP